MATATGRSDVSAYLANIEKGLPRLMAGAGRAAGKVIAEEAKDRSASDDVAEAVIVRTRTRERETVVTITVKDGFTFAKALWLEYGTSPHFITVRDAERGGRGIRRINEQVREQGGNGSLVIGGNFVGETVFHPGARPYPFLRPSFDIKRREALAAAQAYINRRASRLGIAIGPESDDE